MRNIVLIALAMGLALEARAEKPEPLTGVQLLDHCATAVRVMEQGSGTAAEHYDYAFCLAYVLGSGDGMRIGSFKVVANTVEINATTPSRFGSVGVCAPSDAAGEQLVRVVLKYLQQHPELLHKPAGDLVWTALHDAFPCPK